MRMQLTLHAEKLKNVGGKFRDRVSDPYAEVVINGGPMDGTILGKTETVKDCLSPEWVKVFFVEIEGSETYMPFKVSVYDENGGKREDKLMAEAHFVDILSVYQSDGHTDYIEVEGGGKVYATVTKSKKGPDEGLFEIELRGLDIKNVELGVLQLGRSDPYYIIKKKSADHAAGVVRWIPVYRSEHIIDNLNPYWQKATIGLEELCYCNTKWPLKVAVWDWQKNGKHREIGAVETTVDCLVSRIARRGNADREQAIPIVGDVVRARSFVTGGENCGLLVVVSAKVIRVQN